MRFSVRSGDARLAEHISEISRRDVQKRVSLACLFDEQIPCSRMVIRQEFNVLEMATKLACMVTKQITQLIMYSFVIIAMTFEMDFSKLKIPISFQHGLLSIIIFLENTYEQQKPIKSPTMSFITLKLREEALEYLKYIFTDKGPTNALIKIFSHTISKFYLPLTQHHPQRVAHKIQQNQVGVTEQYKPKRAPLSYLSRFYQREMAFYVLLNK